MSFKHSFLVIGLATILSVASADSSPTSAQTGTNCVSGKTLGQWNLPTRAGRGFVRGLLYEDGERIPEFALSAQLLLPTLPALTAGGEVSGTLYVLERDGTAREFAEVKGTYVMRRDGRGRFGAVIQIPSDTRGKPPVEIGKINGIFGDSFTLLPDPTGRYAGRWTICR
jgi:hypothetical protein